MSRIVSALLLIGFFSFPDYCLADGFCAEEIQRASAVRQRIEQEWPLRPNDEVVQFVRRFGRDLAARSGDSRSWHFDVVRDYSANAYSIGNGFIYITEGALVLADGDSELAAMLAHEMGHDQAGHFCTRDTPTGWLDSLFGWMVPKFGESDRGSRAGVAKGSLRQGWDPAKEREANGWARKSLAGAEYDPDAVDRVAWKLENRFREGHAPDSTKHPGDLGRGRIADDPAVGSTRPDRLRTIQSLLRQARP